MPGIKAWILIIRSEARTIIFTWSLIASILIASEFKVEIPRLIIAAVGSYSLSLSIYVFGALMDINEDKINSPQRPLASGAASKYDAMTLGSLTFVAALIAGFLINILTAAFFVGAFLLGLSYSCPPIRAKERFPHKLLVPAVGAVVCTLTGGVVVGVVNAAIILASIVFALFSLVTLLLGDVADLEGDITVGVCSLSVLIGEKNTVKITLLIPFVIMLLSLVSYSMVGLNNLFLGLITILSVYSSLMIGTLLRKSDVAISCRGVKGKMRIVHLALQLSFVIGLIPFA
ncbi:MAG: UbiA family prenyltransferase [Nitrososphaerales archaeon]